MKPEEYRNSRVVGQGSQGGAAITFFFFSHNAALLARVNVALRFRSYHTLSIEYQHRLVKNFVWNARREEIPRRVIPDNILF